MWWSLSESIPYDSGHPHPCDRLMPPSDLREKYKTLTPTQLLILRQHSIPMELLIEIISYHMSPGSLVNREAAVRLAESNLDRVGGNELLDILELNSNDDFLGKYIQKVVKHNRENEIGNKLVRALVKEATSAEVNRDALFVFAEHIENLISNLSSELDEYRSVSNAMTHGVDTSCVPTETYSLIARRKND